MTPLLLKNRARRTTAQTTRTCASAEAGQAIVETALVLPIFLALLLGAIEVGRIAYASIEIASAARAGVAFAAQNHADAIDTTNITLAATQAAPDLRSVSATSSQVCSCSNASSTAVSCKTIGATCLSPHHIEVNVTVNVTGHIRTFFGVPGIPDNLTLQSSSTMRVEQ